MDSFKPIQVDPTPIFQGGPPIPPHVWDLPPENEPEKQQLESFLTEEEVSVPSKKIFRVDWQWWRKKRDIFIGGAQNSILALFLLLTLGATLTVMVFSFIQFGNVTETAAGSSLVVPDSDVSPCSISPHRPLRFRFQKDPDFLECSWNSKNQALRLVWCFITIFFPVLCLWSLRTGKRWALWIFSFLSFVAGVLFFYSMVIDSNDVRISSDWCNDGLLGINLNNNKIDCNYWPYATLCFLDAAAFLFWIASCALSIWHVRKNMNKSIFTSMGR